MRSPPVTFTVDLEDPTETYAADGRYCVMASRLLDLCDAYHCHATFFTIGRVAQAAPDLVRQIAARGHEIAYHSHNHVSLTEETPERMRKETRDDKDSLEQLAGRAVIGYRAPRYSMTQRTLWATEALAELGFVYSSSVMPTRFSLFGFPGAPAVPFKWPSGLIELPLPVQNFGSIGLPYAGGIYLYAMPSFITSSFFALAPTEAVLWTYAHPYDLDRDQPYAPMPHTPDWVSRVLWLARRVSEKKLRGLMAHGMAAPFCERITASNFIPQTFKP